MWQKQDVHKGDRKRLFTTVKAAIGDGLVLYPGSYVDVAASMAFSSVTYVDVDKRAARFFEDIAGVSEIVVSEGGSTTATINFVHDDYTTDLGLEEHAAVDREVHLEVADVEQRSRVAAHASSSSAVRVGAFSEMSK